MKLNIKTSWDGGNKGLHSFLNPYSFVKLYDSGFLLACDDVDFYVDGGLLAKILTAILGTKIERVSFDYSSVANEVFSEIFEGREKFSIIGSDVESITEFRNYLIASYDFDLELGYFRDGYFQDDELDSIYDQIKDSSYLICGMGAVLQEKFIRAMAARGWSGTAYTCGGFIHQTAMAGGEYYPKYINELGLRWLYRMIKEPEVWRRYVFDYPIAISRIFYLCVTRKISFNLE